MGKSTKSTISMAISSSELLNYQRVNDVNSGFSVWDHLLSIGSGPSEWRTIRMSPICHLACNVPALPTILTEFQRQSARSFTWNFRKMDWTISNLQFPGEKHHLPNPFFWDIQPAGFFPSQIGYSATPGTLCQGWRRPPSTCSATAWRPSSKSPGGHGDSHGAIIDPRSVAYY